MDTFDDTLRRTVGDRIRMAREAKGWTQGALAEQLGIADRQTISTIESGARKVSAEEMVRLIGVLGRSLNYFTDPHLVLEENVFSYRAKPEAEGLAEFERQSKKLIELNRRMRTLLKEAPPPMYSGLRGLSKTSHPETAEFFGYRFFVNWQLGNPPAKKLPQVIAKQQRILVLHLDAPRDISGAACHLDDGDVILLNRSQPSYRRTYTLGHELFHLLTWMDMPPEKVDDPEKTDKKSKVEQLADAFTANLLVPSTLLRPVWDRSKGTDLERVLAVARHFDVSGQTAYYRLTNCRYLRDPERSLLPHLSRSDDDTERPPPLEPAFVQRLHTVLADGRMTANAAADFLELSREELPGLFAEHGLSDPVNT